MKKIEYPYEILIRGSRNGGFSHAHMRRMLRVEDEAGALVAPEKELDAEPLDLAAVESVLGAMFPRLANEVAELRERNRALAGELASIASGGKAERQSG